MTAELLHALIEKIVVHEAVKSSGGMREQEVEIFYRLVGGITRYLVRQMSLDIEALYGTEVLLDVLSRNPVYLFGGIICIVGLVVVIGGIALAVFLKKKFCK